ncbi:hypothetical protein [Bdellovibrio sp. HCB337]|uniref:hypothetical protein n=1 Tax=Bdellovibrio sp. HCB337 TaxID=3394358 RepID=UPI0039A71D10
MTKAKMVLKGVLILLLLGAVFRLGIYEFFREYMAKARESEAKTQLSSFYTAEQAFYAEFKEYSADHAKIGYSPEGQLRGKFYYSLDQVPVEIASKLPSEAKPYFEKDAYRVLCLMAYDETLVAFTIDHNKVLQRFDLSQAK